MPMHRALTLAVGAAAFALLPGAAFAGIASGQTTVADTDDSGDHPTRVINTKEAVVTYNQTQLRVKLTLADVDTSARRTRDFIQYSGFNGMRSGNGRGIAPTKQAIEWRSDSAGNKSVVNWVSNNGAWSRQSCAGITVVPHAKQNYLVYTVPATCMAVTPGVLDLNIATRQYANGMFTGQNPDVATPAWKYDDSMSAELARGN